MTAPAQQPVKPTEQTRIEAIYRFFQSMPLPCFTFNRSEGLAVANQAMADIFGYDDVRKVEELLKNGGFLPAHFSSNVLGQLYEMLYNNRRVSSWPMLGTDLAGRDLTIEATVEAQLSQSQGPVESMNATFARPASVRDAEAFLQKAKIEAEQATRSKNEFLSNISHELKTPLNIIIGTLSLATEDETLDESLKEDLGLAKEAADNLFGVVTDLILLSNLEARRLVGDVVPFNADLLLKTLCHQFAAKAAAEEVELIAETDEQGETIFEGGFNLIILALEKLLSNALKFAGQGGKVWLSAKIVTKDDGGHLMQCLVQDSGPGLNEEFLKKGCGLFQQGDGSMNRRHGGLGLGLYLASSLASALGGQLTLCNRPEGGAEVGITVPVTPALVDYDN